MPRYRKRYISPYYKNYIGGHACIFCGVTPVDIHHESVTTHFSGGVKKYNDFTAIPACHECHLGGIHQYGSDFWTLHELNPVEVVKGFLDNYVRTLNVGDFNTAEDYLDNLEMADDTLRMIAEAPVNWD